MGLGHRNAMCFYLPLLGYLLSEPSSQAVLWGLKWDSVWEKLKLLALGPSCAPSWHLASACQLCEWAILKADPNPPDPHHTAPVVPVERREELSLPGPTQLQIHKRKWRQLFQATKLYSRGWLNWPPVLPELREENLLCIKVLHCRNKTYFHLQECC